jgi:hypothetical protein
VPHRKEEANSDSLRVVSLWHYIKCCTEGESIRCLTHLAQSHCGVFQGNKTKLILPLAISTGKLVIEFFNSPEYRELM